jgi:hypothetical protein
MIDMKKFRFGMTGMFVACTLAGSILGLASTTRVAAQTSPATPSAPAMQAGPEMTMGKDKHPEMRVALRHLKNAAIALGKAEHDMAGHRDKALDLTNQAIAECEAAMKVDN